MKAHKDAIFKRNFEFILFIGISSFCLLALFSNLVMLAKAKKPVIIAIDSNGTRIVNDQNDPIYKTEGASFFQKFIANLYNFNSENFMKRIGMATTMMSEELWSRKRNEILDLKTKVERDEISIQSSVQKMTLDEVGNFYGLIRVVEKTRLNTREHNVKVALKLKAVERTQDNPAGLEVESYEETIVR